MRPRRFTDLVVALSPFRGLRGLPWRDFDGIWVCYNGIIGVNSVEFLTEFGGMVSTSNELIGDVAVVETDKYVLWTIEMRIFR
jgi:hypothetical protein